MKVAIEILTFRRMVAPVLLQLLFWGAMGGVVYGSVWLFVHDNWAWWMAALFGTLSVRVIFEGAILAFRAYERLCEMRDALAGGA